MEKATAAARNYNSESLFGSETDCDEETITFAGGIEAINHPKRGTCCEHPAVVVRTKKS